MTYRWHHPKILEENKKLIAARLEAKRRQIDEAKAIIRDLEQDLSAINGELKDRK